MKSADIVALEKLIREYQPYNGEEAQDKGYMLWYLDQFGGKALCRECLAGHFTASVFLFNQDHSKVLMCYHLVDRSWAWLGGHADGIAALKEVALREVMEEAGISCKLVNDGKIAALTCIPIGGHIKRGSYVSSHVHLDVAFVGEADENEKLTIKSDENSGLKWIPVDKLQKMITDEWRMNYTYAKLIEQFK